MIVTTMVKDLPEKNLDPEINERVLCSHLGSFQAAVLLPVNVCCANRRNVWQIWSSASPSKKGLGTDQDRLTNFKSSLLTVPS